MSFEAIPPVGAVRRTASCQCGQLAVCCTGEPAVVSVCHCLDCQRRTGSVFGAGAFFARDQVVVEAGHSSRYRRESASGSGVVFHFCGQCGSTVWWEPERVPSMVGVAVGSFADPDFPAPVQGTWSERQHRWLQLPDTVVSFAQGVVRAPPSA